MDEAKIVLDQDTFKALAAGTRVKILKTLEKRRHTQSELSAVLKISVPTAKEHLIALEKAGLVKRHEEGRKWIYYSLTEKSKCVLDPERKRLWIVLGFFLASVAGTFIAARNYFAGRVATFGGAEPTRMLAAKQAVAEVAMDSAEEAVQAVPTAAEAVNQAVVSSQPPYILIGFVVLTLVLLILAIYFYKKSKLGKSLNKK
ncbi:winged helix-turn-helix domain-containing protein [Candidatus Woesearchaeota archaeon]|nr:winged helix-turn-helix domain-containing protein [Candidatus Woesearchaeota archaeon]MBW3005752.1 winged helix-turn-helix domain-containing protein [Candidatus Woesearchaeota archaeon]